QTAGPIRQNAASNDNGNTNHDISLINTSPTAITISSINVTWTGNNRRLTGVNFGGGGPEWSGDLSSPTGQFNLTTTYTIPASSTVNLRLTFSGPATNATLTIGFSEKTVANGGASQEGLIYVGYS
ncbi:MAG: hypothetical protein HY998_00105, partial [candidate division NC10 bacterium]|nr:hypothetical protein [candidate division NC10 bacterium]